MEITIKAGMAGRSLTGIFPAVGTLQKIRCARKRAGSTSLKLYARPGQVAAAQYPECRGGRIGAIRQNVLGCQLQQRAQSAFTSAAAKSLFPLDEDGLQEQEEHVAVGQLCSPKVCTKPCAWTASMNSSYPAPKP